MSDYNNDSVACQVLSSEGDSDSKHKVVRVQVLCTHGTQGPQEKSLIEHMLLRSVRKTNKVCRIANIDAVFGGVSCIWSALFWAGPCILDKITNSECKKTTYMLA